MYKRFRKTEAGFTLIELLVAMTIFSIVIVAVTDVFVSGLGGAQRIFGQQVIQESGRFILESLAKEARMSKINTAEGGPFTSLSVTNSNNQDVVYALSGTNITRSVDGGPSQNLNPDDILVSGGFYIKNSGDFQRRLTIVLKLKNNATETAAQTEINLQTTISSREYAE